MYTYLYCSLAKIFKYFELLKIWIASFLGFTEGFIWMRFCIRSLQVLKGVFTVKTFIVLQCLAVRSNNRLFSFCWRLVRSKWMKIIFFLSFRECSGFLFKFLRALMLIPDLDLLYLILRAWKIASLNLFFFLVISWRIRYDLPEAEGPAMIITSLLRSSLMCFGGSAPAYLNLEASTLQCWRFMGCAWLALLILIEIGWFLHWNKVSCGWAFGQEMNSIRCRQSWRGCVHAFCWSVKEYVSKKLEIRACQRNYFSPYLTSLYSRF